MLTTDRDRLTAEQLFHDRQAAERSQVFQSGRADLQFADGDYLDHETWIRSAMARLNLNPGDAVLDYGCGHGMAAVVLARVGAQVSAFDLSPGYIAEARERARVNRVTVNLTVANGEDLPYAAESFDAVWGHAILHHLDLTRASAELLRVLRPGGVAVFCEPWGGNPFLSLARRYLPYPGKHRTVDERPLLPSDLDPIRAIFPNLEVEGVQLLGMIRRVLPNPVLTRVTQSIDTRLFRWLPVAKNWCRYVVLTMRKV